MTILKEDEIPDAKYHTVKIEETDDGDWHVVGKAADALVSIYVGSIGIGPEAVGLAEGSVRFDAADSWIRLNYVDFDEYGYDEIQVTFEER
jgi:hypothetical protein